MSSAQEPGRRSWGGRLLMGLWPFLAVALFGLWITRPLWRYTPMVFSKRLFIDGVMGPWFYDFVARRVAQGEIPQYFRPFDWPCPRDTLSLPNVWDAVLASPLVYLLDWPTQWSAQMALVLILNGLGLAWLARSMGCRGWTVAFAGGLGLTFIPLWHELQEGRVNAAWTGVVFAAMAAFLDLARRGSRMGDGWQAVVVETAPRMLIASLLGALTLSIYPPYAVLVAPAAFALLLPHLIRRWQAAVAVALALVAGVALAAGELSRMVDFMARFYVNGGDRCVAGSTPCPYDNGHAYLMSLIQIRPLISVDVFRHATASALVWLTLPAAALARGSRRYLALVVVWAGALVYLSLGPCPRVDSPSHAGAITIAHLPRLLERVWCLAWDIHRMERFLTVGLGLVAVVAARGMEAARRRWRPALQAPLFLLALATIAHSAWLLRADLFLPENWAEAQRSVVASALRGSPRQVVAVLPFDGSVQFFTDLQAPGHRYLNPLELEHFTRSDNPFITWIKALGRWEDAGPPPSAEAIAESGVDQVFYDPLRCRTAGKRAPGSCHEALPRLLTEALGEPEFIDGLVLRWRLSPTPGAAARQEAACSR